MYRQIFFPTESNHVIELPKEYYGLEIEVIAFPISESKNIASVDLDSFYDSFNIDFSKFKFNRDEANER